MESPASFVWDVRVTSSGRGAATAQVRSHRLEMGPPLSFDREEGRVTALEHVLAAIGSDLVGNIERIARKRRLPVDGLEATVEGTLRNPLAYLQVVGEEGDPGLRSVRVRVYFTTTADAEAVETAWREAAAASPLVNTFRPLLSLELSLKTVI